MFPIDYSLTKYEKEENLSRRTVELLLDSKAIRSTLDKMFFDRDAASSETEKKKRPAIPVEAKPFFDEFFKLYHDLTYTSTRTLVLEALNGSSNKTAREALDDFTYQLFQRLCDRVSVIG